MNQQDQHTLDQQQAAFLLQISRQLETVLAACRQNGVAEVMIGSKRHANKVLQVKLVAEEKTLTVKAPPAQSDRPKTDRQSDWQATDTSPP